MLKHHVHLYRLLFRRLEAPFLTSDLSLDPQDAGFGDLQITSPIVERVAVFMIYDFVLAQD